MHRMIFDGINQTPSTIAAVVMDHLRL
uniref:Uncharacterized protein n=1 Tax=Arundo donax TaxID=35708 RepID=A0A0A9A2U3_ARUDO